MTGRAAKRTATAVSSPNRSGASRTTVFWHPPRVVSQPRCERNAGKMVSLPLKCSAAEFERFVRGSEAVAAGRIGFYWGKTPEECRRSKAIGDTMMLGWLEYFRRRAGELGE